MQTGIKQLIKILCAATFLAAIAPPAGAAEDEQPQKADEPKRVPPVAIFAFDERGKAVEGYGKKITDILFAELVTNPRLYLVDRADLAKVLDEAELNLSGMVTADKATRVGQLTGAKILLTGSVFEVGEKIYLVAKVIGTETTRVLGESVKGPPSEGLDKLTEKLAKKVAEVITNQAAALLPPPSQPSNIIAELNERLGDAKRPVLAIEVSEQHVGHQVLDPAVETELIRVARGAGFEVLDPEKVANDAADVRITGEAFSEFAARRSNLISVKARVELRAVDLNKDKVIVSDRQTAIEIDLAENIAAKSALQQAAQTLAQRLLVQIAE